MAKMGLLVLLSLLFFTSLPSAIAQRFANTDQSSLFKRIQSSSSGYVDVDSNEFASIVGVPRDYAVTALLTTTSGNIKCPPCVAFQPEFEKLAQQWNKDKAVKSKHVFVKVEFSKDNPSLRSSVCNMLLSYTLSRLQRIRVQSRNISPSISIRKVSRPPKWPITSTTSLTPNSSLSNL